MLMSCRIIFGSPQNRVLLTVRTVTQRGFNYVTSKYACSSGLKVTVDASVLYKLNVNP